MYHIWASPFVLLACLLSLAQDLTQTIPRAQAGAAPRVYLQTVSKGTGWNAHRDQTIEMAKDFQKDCPDVRVTVAPDKADYTVVLNHIEHGFARDNQIAVTNKEGDLLATREKGGINSSVKAVCELILADWQEVSLPKGKKTGPKQGSSDSVGEGGNAPVPNASTQVFSNASIGASSDEDAKLRRDGVTLTAVPRGGPADQAGIKAGDVILAINDHYLFTVEELNGEIHRHKPGTTIAVRYRRYSTIYDVSLVVGTR